MGRREWMSERRRDGRGNSRIRRRANEADYDVEGWRSVTEVGTGDMGGSGRRLGAIRELRPSEINLGGMDSTTTEPERRTPHPIVYAYTPDADSTVPSTFRRISNLKSSPSWPNAGSNPTPAPSPCRSSVEGWIEGVEGGGEVKERDFRRFSFDPTPPYSRFYPPPSPYVVVWPMNRRWEVAGWKPAEFGGRKLSIAERRKGTTLSSSPSLPHLPIPHPPHSSSDSTRRKGRGGE